MIFLKFFFSYRRLVSNYCRMKTLLQMFFSTLHLHISNFMSQSQKYCQNLTSLSSTYLQIPVHALVNLDLISPSACYCVLPKSLLLIILCNEASSTMGRKQKRINKVQTYVWYKSMKLQ